MKHSRRTLSLLILSATCLLVACSRGDLPGGDAEESIAIEFTSGMEISYKAYITLSDLYIDRNTNPLFTPDIEPAGWDDIALPEEEGHCDCMNQAGP